MLVRLYGTYFVERHGGESLLTCITMQALVPPPPRLVMAAVL